MEKRKHFGYRLSTCLYFGAAGVLATFYYPFLNQEVGLDLKMIGKVTSFGAMFALASQPLLGLLFSKSGRKKRFMEWYMVLLIGILALMFAVRENWIFAFAVFYGCIAIPLIGIYEVFIENISIMEGFSYAGVRKWGSVGMGSITLIGGAITTRFSFGTFHILGILFLIVCILLVKSVFPEVSGGERGCERDSERGSKKDSETGREKGQRIRLREMFSSRYVNVIYLICFLGIGSYVGSDFAFSSYLVHLCKDSSTANWLFGFSTGTKIFLEFIVFMILGKWGRGYHGKKGFLAVFLFAGIRFLLITTGLLPLVILGDLMHCIVFPLFLSVIFPYLRGFVAEEKVAGCYSIVAMLMYGVSNFVYPVLFAEIMEQLGYRGIYLSDVLLAAAAIMTGMVFLPKEKGNDRLAEKRG